MPEPSLTTVGGEEVRPLGLAGYPDQDPRFVAEAFAAGVNLFFFYGPSHRALTEGLSSLVPERRREILVATGSGARTPGGLGRAWRELTAAAGVDEIDLFFAEYVHPSEDPEAVFGEGGALEVIDGWKREGRIRHVGATAHDRSLAARLARDPRVEVLMHRFNMAHRGALETVFPAARESGVALVTFTSTRWGSLLERHPGWEGDPPDAVDCYRYCLSFPEVDFVLTAPKTMEQLRENLAVLEVAPFDDEERRRWERYGDLVYGEGTDSFETKWP